MPELTESIERINYHLLREFGVEELAGGRPKFRVVWSEDQIEKRWCSTTPDGFDLIHPEVMEVKKYGYVKERYILERLIPVNDSELLTKVSYEPAWTFEDNKGNYLPPRFDACKLIVEWLMSIAEGNQEGKFKRYTDPTVTPEGRKAELDKVSQELFGNETEISDALHYKEGIIVPTPLEEKENVN